MLSGDRFGLFEFARREARGDRGHADGARPELARGDREDEGAVDAARVADQQPIRAPAYRWLSRASFSSRGPIAYPDV